MRETYWSLIFCYSRIISVTCSPLSEGDYADRHNHLPCGRNQSQGKGYRRSWTTLQRKIHLQVCLGWTPDIESKNTKLRQQVNIPKGYTPEQVSKAVFEHNNSF